ncbi:helix-turn-helix domain-containing protein [Bacillus sp. AR2-1]|uniref:helix-turn-helix domain-containing protein n=1 Tax=Bacillus sp. AR2-1 TaxID=2217816 RepID=UPI0021043E68|nr:helix-turn-helix domain-containing protein [Bacillus sp. AR2-1]
MLELVKEDHKVIIIAITEYRDYGCLIDKDGNPMLEQNKEFKGRPKKYTENNRGLQYALELFHNRPTNKMTVKEIEEITKVSKATLYRAVRKQKCDLEKLYIYKLLYI